MDKYLLNDSCITEGFELFINESSDPKLSTVKFRGKFQEANAINKNKNNSYDIGMMQINSFWLPTLAKYGITANDLLNPCTSVFVGSWIMAQNIKRFGFNQDGIGAYNSPGNITIRRRYAQAVYTAYNKIVQDFRVVK